MIRNQPGSVPRLKGWIHVDDGVPSVWIVGLDITPVAPPGEKGDVCIQMQGADVRVINNYIHDCGRNGISAWRPNQSNAPGQLVYGNVIARSDHGDLRAEPLRRGRLQEVRPQPGPRHPERLPQPRTASASTDTPSSGWNSGLWVEESIVRGARFLVGGTNSRTRHSVVKENVFYAAGPQIAYTSSGPARRRLRKRRLQEPASPSAVGDRRAEPLHRQRVHERAAGRRDERSAAGRAGETPAAVKDANGKSQKTTPEKGKPAPSRFHPKDVIDGNTYLATEGGPIRSTWWLPDKRRLLQGEDARGTPGGSPGDGLHELRGEREDDRGPRLAARLPVGERLREGPRRAGDLPRRFGGGRRTPTVPVDLSPVVESGARLHDREGGGRTGRHAGVVRHVRRRHGERALTGEFEAFLVLPGAGTATPAQ